MENIMTYDTLHHFAYSNDRICQKPIRGVVLSFFGLGGQDMYNGDTADGLFFAAKGILYLVPYNNPWAWMNKQAVSYTDELVDLLINHYHLSPNIPIVSTGGSMGGLSCLIYALYASHTWFTPGIPLSPASPIVRYVIFPSITRSGTICPEHYTALFITKRDPSARYSNPRHRFISSRKCRRRIT